MVAELTSVTGSGSRKSAADSGTSRPLWIQTATRPKAHNYMQASSEPARQRGVVGLVGPYNPSMEEDEDEEEPSGRSMFVLKDEELVEEEVVEPVITSTPGSPTPGRENWKLQGRLLDQRRAMSMTDVWPKAWGMYNEQHQEQDSLNEPSSGPEQPAGGAKGGGHHHHHHHHKPRTLLGILTAGRNNTNLDMLDNAEPFCQLWILLSSLYGKLIVVLMLAFCITEVMDNSVKLLSLQGIFLMYLYVGSIAVIICIYIWVLIDSCASLSDRSDPASTAVPTTGGDAELGNASLARFGSLKRAHISRDRTSGTNFYLRVGALAFGLGTLVFNGLEMAMHSMMEGACLNDVVFVHPVLHGLFTFLQMHFLFVNSQVLVERFGLAARFGFMHLAATNLALWVRLIVWESGNEWTYFVHLAQGSGARSTISNNIPTPLQLRGFPRYMTTTRQQRDLTFSSNVTSHFVYRPISDTHISQVVSLHECLNTNSLGQLWTSSMPFLYPFIVQFSLIAAAVTFVMGQHVGRDRLFQKQKKLLTSHGKTSAANERSLVNTWGVDCGGASKGLFLGILCMVAGIVVIIIFLVVKEDADFPPDTIFWLTSGALAAMLALCCVMTSVGLVQVRKLSISGRQPTILDSLLTTVSSLGVQLYAAFGAVVGAAGLVESSQGRHAMLLAVSLLQLIQTSAQSTLMAEALRRSAITRHQMLTKPARQVVTFLLCSNAVLWAYDTFVTQSWLSQELQLRFFGVLAWGVVSRIGLPLLVFYRFHSCVLLLEVWKRSYRTPLLDPGN